MTVTANSGATLRRARPLGKPVCRGRTAEAAAICRGSTGARQILTNLILPTGEVGSAKPWQILTNQSKFGFAVQSDQSFCQRVVDNLSIFWRGGGGQICRGQFVEGYQTPLEPIWSLIGSPFVITVAVTLVTCWSDAMRCDMV